MLGHTPSSLHWSQETSDGEECMLHAGETTCIWGAAMSPGRADCLSVRF
ncbi:MAG: hypothetical protein ACFE9C_07700 [Candidatus Hodarchaeota archaeon]